MCGGVNHADTPTHMQADRKGSVDAREGKLVIETLQL